ncbi:MAG: type II secretion system protein [Candidatus Berkelbacteria bacterium]|nr:type II secretion system protein [Candidatus Berkelbacteria bacterium]
MKKGLTLIELIVYIGIVSIVLVVMIDLSTNLVYSQKKATSKTEVQQNISLISQDLINQISNATAVTGAPTNDLNLTTATGTIAYSISSNALQVSTDGGLPVPISNSKVVVSPPPGGQIFTKVTNGSGISVKINMVISLTTDINTKAELKTSVLVRGK